MKLNGAFLILISIFSLFLSSILPPQNTRKTKTKHLLMENLINYPKPKKNIQTATASSNPAIDRKFKPKKKTCNLISIVSVCIIHS